MVAHVTVAVQMHHERDGGYYNKEQCRNRVEQESDADYKIIVKRQPVLIENHSLKAGVGVGIYKFGVAGEEISERSDIGKHHSDAHTGCAEDSGPAVTQLMAA